MNIPTIDALSGHTSPDTAYLVNDYPYGFRLRCQIRYWLEFKKNHGFRLMSQTTNPKRPGTVWNKPKASTYMMVGVMGLNELGHVTWTGAGYGNSVDEIASFRARYGAALDDNGLKALTVLEAMALRFSRMTYTVTCTPLV